MTIISTSSNVPSALAAASDLAESSCSEAESFAMLLSAGGGEDCMLLLRFEGGPGVIEGV